METSGEENLLSQLMAWALDDIIDELSIGVCFEVHRSIKLNYFHLDDLFRNQTTQHHAVHQPASHLTFQTSSPCQSAKLPLCTLPYYDVFGLPLNQKKQIDCSCPSCGRLVAATRLAPHLEKCMGMGRSSSRLASRRLTQSSSNPVATPAMYSAVQPHDVALMDPFGLNEFTRTSNSPSSGSEKASMSSRVHKVKSKTKSSFAGVDESHAKKKKMSSNQQKLFKEAVRIVNSVNTFPEYLALKYVCK